MYKLPKLNTNLYSIALKALNKKNLSNKTYLDRLDYEYKIIKKLNFEDYFKICYQIVQIANDNDIAIGLGRGSCCSSLMLYALGIHKIDPIKYDLPFERFLNSTRLNDLPDVDLDIDATKRDLLINLLSNRFKLYRIKVNANGELRDHPSAIYILENVKDYYQENNFNYLNELQDELTKLGIPKFDLLSSNITTKISQDLNIANLTLKDINFNDSNAFKHLNKILNQKIKGEIFNIKNYNKNFTYNLKSIEDLRALLALIRPRTKLEYPKLFKEMGILEFQKHGILFDEDFMKIFRISTASSLELSDRARRVVKSKDVEAIAKLKDFFFNQIRSQNALSNDEDIEEAFNYLESIDYSFNKAHATAYALTAYLDKYLDLYIEQHNIKRPILNQSNQPSTLSNGFKALKLEDIKLSDVIKAYGINLKQTSNGEYIGLCPFHDDKSPSFHVSDNKGICTCFSCNNQNEGSLDAIGFIKKIENCNFKEAINKLSKITNLDATSFLNSNKEEIKRLNDINYFYLLNASYALYQDKEAMNYLSSRGIYYKDLKDNKPSVGYVNEWLINKLKSKYSLDDLKALNIVDDDGNAVSLNRLIFPLINRFNTITGFQSRSLTDKSYMNSKDSSFFKKRETVYKLEKKTDECFIIEGVFDALSCFKMGNTAIAVGTARILDEQLEILKNYNAINLCFDSDDAGIEGAFDSLKKIALKYPAKSINLIALCNRSKDANDLLLANRLEEHLSKKIPDYKFYESCVQNVHESKKALIFLKSEDETIKESFKEAYRNLSNIK